MMRFLFPAALGLCLALPAHARTVTLTFDNAPLGGEMDPYDMPPYVEQGVSVKGAAIWSLGLLHLDDSGTAFPYKLEISTGAPFSPVSVGILGHGQGSVREIFNEETGWFDRIPTPYDNVILEGYRGGDLVAFDSYSTGLEEGWFDYRFAADFRSIDLLVIENTSYPLPEGVTCYDAPCAHISLDDLRISLAPVPLPASGGLLTAGLVAAMGLRKSKKRADCVQHGADRA